MKQLSRWLFLFKKPIHNVLGALCLFLVSQATVAFLLGSAKFEILALQWTIDANEAIALLQSWNSEVWSGIWGHYKWDFVHPFIYSYCLAVWIQASRTKHTKGISKLVPFAFLVGSLDLLENICHVIALSRFPETIESLFLMGGVLAISKWISAAFIIMIALASPMLPAKLSTRQRQSPIKGKI